MDGVRLVQRWVCSLATMPNGAPGVLWRGAPYRLRDGDRIDVGAPADPAPDPGFTVLPGEEATWVLLQGLPEDVDHARSGLHAEGIQVARSGRWLGEPVAGVAFDWFLRCAGQVPPEAFASALPGAAPASAAPDPASRIAMLKQRVAELLAEQAQVRAAVQRARQPRAPAPPEPAMLAELRSAATDHELAAAVAKIVELEAALTATPTARAAAAAPRLHEDVAAALAALRPDIVLLRDSLRVITGELSSRAGVYRALQVLPSASGARTGGRQWKALQRVERWWERHVSTGQADDARAYARFSEQIRQWHLLIGWKTEQTRDIQRLARQ